VRAIEESNANPGLGPVSAALDVDPVPPPARHADADGSGLCVRLDLYLWLYGRFCKQSSHLLTLHVLLDRVK